MKRPLFTLFVFIYILISTMYSASSEEKVDISVDGKSLVVRNVDVVANCCSKFNDDISLVNKKIIITQTDTSTTKCKCECSFDLIHTINNLQAGKYRIEIYREELKKFGYPEDRKFLVAQLDYEVQFEIPKSALFYDFRQSPCKSNTRVNTINPYKKINLEAFPNPTKSELNIRFNSNSLVEGRFVIYNFIGKEVFAADLKLMQDGLHTLNYSLNFIPSGIYIGKILLSNGSTETIKIVWSK